MLRFDLNLSMTVPEGTLLERMARAAALGFGAVEFFWPAGVDHDALVAARAAHGLTVVLMNTDTGGPGDRGLLSHPHRRAEWTAILRDALALAARLGCTRLHAVAGTRLPDLPHAAQLDCAVANLVSVLPELEAAGVTVCVEALNHYDNPGFFLTRLADMLEICRQVNSPHVRMQYDVYHMQRMEGNLIPSIQQHVDWIGHVQIADAPSRHQPGTGEIAYARVLAALEETGYGGYVGLEFVPQGPLADALAWLPPTARRATTAAALLL